MQSIYRSWLKSAGLKFAGVEVGTGVAVGIGVGVGVGVGGQVTEYWIEALHWDEQLLKLESQCFQVWVQVYRAGVPAVQEMLPPCPPLKLQFPHCAPPSKSSL